MLCIAVLQQAAQGSQDACRASSRLRPLHSHPRPSLLARLCRWHPQSTMTHEAGLAVARLGGEGAFWRFSDALYERQADFFDEAVWDMSRRQVPPLSAPGCASPAHGLHAE